MATGQVGSGGNGSSMVGLDGWAGGLDTPRIEYIPKSSKSWERIRGIYSLLVRKEYYRFQSFMSWIITLKLKKICSTQART